MEAFSGAVGLGYRHIETDLHLTKDGVLVARHENEISGTTDVASREEFASRQRSKTIDGALVTGWFAEDFTLAELRTLIRDLRRVTDSLDGGPARHILGRAAPKEFEPK